jgi:hypothetical protein
MDIDGVRSAVLGNLGTRRFIAITAIERAEIGDGLQGAAELPDSRSHLLSDPTRDDLSHSAADNGRRVDGNPFLVW